jgi:hypothetical protein
MGYVLTIFLWGNLTGRRQVLSSAVNKFLVFRNICISTSTNILLQMVSHRDLLQVDLQVSDITREDRF